MDVILINVQIIHILSDSLCLKLHKGNKIPYFSLHSRVGLDIAAMLAQASIVPSKKREKEANRPALTLIQDYNAFNRSPKGLAG